MPYKDPIKNAECKKRWYFANKKEIKKRLKERSKTKAFKEGHKKRNKKWYESHQKQIKNKRKENSKKHKEYMKEYYQKNKEKLKEYSKQQYHNNPEVKFKHSVRTKAQKIIIPKGTLCQKCHQSLAVERHHPDYSQPLKVIFVCRDCHRLIHAHVNL